MTVLKYSPEPFAKVNFWSEAELKELGITQDKDDDIAEIYGGEGVKFESKTAQNLNVKFNGDDESAGKFESPNASEICFEPPASKTVETDEIKRYTSADSKYAKFVKSVELYENLELLKDNVRIMTRRASTTLWLRARSWCGDLCGSAT